MQETQHQANTGPDDVGDEQPFVETLAHDALKLGYDYGPETNQAEPVPQDVRRPVFEDVDDTVKR